MPLMKRHQTRSENGIFLQFLGAVLSFSIEMSLQWPGTSNVRTFLWVSFNQRDHCSTFTYRYKFSLCKSNICINLIQNKALWQKNLTVNQSFFFVFFMHGPTWIIGKPVWPFCYFNVIWNFVVGWYHHRKVTSFHNKKNNSKNYIIKEPKSDMMYIL